MGQVKEADFLRWGNTRRVTSLRKQEQDGMWDGLRERMSLFVLILMIVSTITLRSFIDNFDEFWRYAAKIFPAPGFTQGISSSAPDAYPRSQTMEPSAQVGDKDEANTVRCVPARIHLPDGPVLQDIVMPLNEDGTLSRSEGSTFY